MIYGIGCEIARVGRLARWVRDEAILERFFNGRERLDAPHATEARRCEYYAARFAAKEAFSKALGTGISGFGLRDVYVVKDALGRPELRVEGNAAALLVERCGSGARLHVSLSHEKEYAMAYVIIERG